MLRSPVFSSGAIVYMDNGFGCVVVGFSVVHSFSGGTGTRTGDPVASLSILSALNAEVRVEA
jgi:hypothetical protein